MNTENNTLIGKTVVIQSLNDKGFSAEIESHVNIQFMGFETVTEIKETITISQLTRLNRILIQGAYRGPIGDNGEPTVLNSVAMDDLNRMERFTLNQLGYWTEGSEGVDITKLDQISVLKVVE